MNAFDFNTDFMRVDPFQGREPWNQPDQRMEDRNCEHCGDPLALDENTCCGTCAEEIEALAPPNN